MTDTAAEIDEEPPRKGGKMGLIIGLVLGIVGGGAGFFAMSQDLLGLFPERPTITEDMEAEMAMKKPEPEAKELPPLEFLALDPMTISLGPEARARLLRFSAKLEVIPPHSADVEMLKPRISDVLNTYLRAVSLDELENPAAMLRLRAQMLRRIQLVTGEGRVRDLLISEFILN
ncbi:MAG: flagellar basal body-associated FliL family protein [Pseudomonadota bacterium]